MRLPLVKNNKISYPSKAQCPWCKKNKVLEPHSMAILSAGALLKDQKNDDGGPSDNLDGFLDLTWHGAHDDGEGKDKEIGASLSIAHDVQGGQFDIYFCSTNCLRAFLNRCVDELEKRIKKTRTKKDNKKNI